MQDIINFFHSLNTFDTVIFAHALDPEYITDPPIWVHYGHFDSNFNTLGKDPAFDNMKTLLRMKFSSKLNNHDVLDAIGVTKQTYSEFSVIPSSKLYSKFNAYSTGFIFLLTAVLASFPLPGRLVQFCRSKVHVCIHEEFLGRLGTLVANFIPELELANKHLNDVNISRLENAFVPTHTKNSDEQRQQPQWNRPYVEELAELYPYIKNWQYFTQIFGNMTGIPNLGVSALDIAPMLTPVKDYITQRKYPKQFKYTAAQQMWKTQEPGLQNGKYLQYPNKPANFLKDGQFKNYLGKLLGPHLEVVMEVMYHCMLRTGDIRENWMHHKLYDGKWGGILQFPFNLSSQHFVVDVQKYIGKNSPPFMPIYGKYTDNVEMGYVINVDSVIYLIRTLYSLDE